MSDDEEVKDEGVGDGGSDGWVSEPVEGDEDDVSLMFTDGPVVSKKCKTLTVGEGVRPGVGMGIRICMDTVSSGKNNNKNVKKSRILEENFVAVESNEDVMEEVMWKYLGSGGGRCRL